jgi:hypothetical protein
MPSVHQDYQSAALDDTIKFQKSETLKTDNSPFRLKKVKTLPENN